MKKLIALFFALVCVLGLVGCNNEITDKVQSDGALAEDTTGEVQSDGASEGNTAGEIQPGGTSVEEAFDIAVSYANWADESEIYSGALNKDKIADSSVGHLPIYKFDSLEDLEQFKLTFGEVLAMDYGYDEIPSFNDITKNYDETFFEENTLMLVEIPPECIEVN